MNEIEKALRLAFSFGETHWQQADSDSYSQNKKSEATMKRFHDFVKETCALMEQRTVPAGWKLVPEEPTGAMRLVLLGMLTNCHSIEESYAELLAAAPTYTGEKE